MPIYLIIDEDKNPETFSAENNTFAKNVFKGEYLSEYEEALLFLLIDGDGLLKEPKLIASIVDGEFFD
jgi:hypothetical protein